MLVIGAGWLGEPLAIRLQAEGHRVVVTARQADRINALQSAGLASWRLDLADAGETYGLRDRLEPFQTLIIAIPPARGAQTHYADQLKRLLTHWPEKAVRRLIFYSSTGVYPDAAGWWDENSPLQEEHPVAQAEKIIANWGKNVLILRCGGLCDERRVIGRYFSAKALPNADQVVNYIQLADVIGATIHLLGQETFGCFNLVAPLHPSRQEVFVAQAERYQFSPPSSLQAGGLDRRIAVDKLLATGYVFRQPDPKLF